MLTHQAPGKARCGNMSGRGQNWREACQSARVELDPATQLRSCQKARRLIQRRMVELASGDGNVEQRSELEEALRDLWVIEQRIQKPDIQ